MNSPALSLDAYYQICEALGEEPDSSKLEAYDASGFPEQLQYAYYFYDLLVPVIDGMNGVFYGKDFAPLESLMRIYEVSNQKTILRLMHYLNNASIKRAEKERKRSEKNERSRGGTHPRNQRPRGKGA